MKLRTFTLRLDADGAFDDRELREFMGTADVIEFSDHMLDLGGDPRWAILVAYRAAPASRENATSIHRRDWAAELSPAARERYELLRAWRNTFARTEGKPAYLVLTNRQLAAVAERIPRSLTELRAIEGIGDARIESYGATILDELRALDGGARRPDGAPGSQALEGDGDGVSDTSASAPSGADASSPPDADE